MKLNKGISISIFLLNTVNLLHCIGQDTSMKLENCARLYQEKKGNRLEALNGLRACVTGIPLPGFNASSITGSNVTSSDIKGTVTLINFWFIGCPPCITELPQLNELYGSLGEKGFKLISFTPDSHEEIKGFMQKHEILFPVVASSGVLIEKTFKINSFGYPTNILINKKGEIVRFTVGGTTDDSQSKVDFAELKKIVLKELQP